MLSRLICQNIGLYLRGHCKILFFQIFFHRDDWDMWVTMLKKVCAIWRWWEKSHLFKNWLKLDQIAPSECGLFFYHLQMTSTLAHMIYCTNKGGFPRFNIFFYFFEFIMPSRLTAE